jgi:hypothetical protein
MEMEVSRPQTGDPVDILDLQDHSSPLRIGMRGRPHASPSEEISM